MWSDQVDQANDLAEIERIEAMKMRKPVPVRTGVCHDCGEPVQHQALFCDVSCRDLWEIRQKQAAIRGRN